MNFYGFIKMLGMSEMLCEIFYDGYVLFVFLDMFEFICDVDVMNYLFDF